MKIDIYAHLIPPEFKDAMIERQLDIKTIKNNPALYDLDTRFRIMDKFPDVVQVLSFPGASVERLGGPENAVDMAKKINDEMAELIYRYPDRFAAGVAVLPMSDMDAALREADRAINDLKLRGVLMRVPVNGRPVDRPEFMPLYEKMCRHNLPIWVHPQRNPKTPEYADETESKHLVWHLWGLVWETTVTMTRFVFGGVLEKFPELKIITHHCGAMVPFFSERIINHYNGNEMRNRANFKVGLTEQPIDYFRRFYNDTAIQGNAPALMCAYHFFGTERLLFGTDAPFDPQLGYYSTNRIIQAIEGMDIPEEDKKKIFEDNARKLMRLPI
jgi:aminocarboxymuconate-semialdehyde decarboxylase